ncbi:MAG: hypothetical protein K0M59_04130 [Stenotrophomonas sp.]|nr:hypothetical protein [Stenotrophomonas sp.]
MAAAAADLKQGAAHRHVWIAPGHGMLAMRMSVDTGQLMADLINGPRRRSIPPLTELSNANDDAIRL